MEYRVSMREREGETEKKGDRERHTQDRAGRSPH
jgi:hypothetical protein